MIEKQPSPLYELAKQSLSNTDRWFGDSPILHSLPHLILSMNGELGKVSSIMKLLDRKETTLKDVKTRVDLAMALADVFIEFLNVCAILGIDPQVIYEQRVIQNERKFAASQRDKDYDKRMELADGIFIKRQSATD